MKLFKRIYYPVLGALIIAALVLGFVDASVGGGSSKTFDAAWESVQTHIETIAESSHNSHNSEQMQRARDYISRVLRENFREMDGETDDDGNFEVSFATSGGKKIPTFTVQESMLTPETVSQIKQLDEGTVIVSRTVRNIVAVIPGEDTLAGNKGSALMLMAHYDSRPEGSGASDNTISVASMLGVIDTVLSGEKTFKNDLVFVFTDAEEEGMYGAYAFKYQFKGFDDVYSRVELGANFDNLGNKGTLVMFQTSEKNSALIKEYAKINGGAFTSSIANFVYGVMSNFTDFEIFDDKTSLDFANVGGTDVYHTYRDSVDNVNKTAVEQHYAMMERMVNTFGGMDLKNLESQSDSVYFSYLDLGVAHYPKAVSYVLGALIILLLAANIAVNALMRKKQLDAGEKVTKGFSLSKAGAGAGVQLLTMVATLAVSFAAYFLICLLLCGFGVIPFHAIATVRYCSVGIMVPVMLLTLAIAFGFYGVFKKLFAVKSADIVRGTVFIWSLIGAVMSFAAPALSYFFVITAILQCAVMLAITLFKDKYREKTGDRMDSLLLYAVPLVFVLPMIVPIIMIAATVLGAVYLPVIMLLFMLVAGFLAPYFTQLQPVFDRVAQKLPPRKIRVERVVTKRIEDRAKKGKFTEQQVKEVTKEPLPWRYKNYFGVSLIATVSVVLVMIFSSFNAGFGSAVAGGTSFRNEIYNDSLVYVWTKNNSSVTRTIEVHDLIAYKYMQPALDGFGWDAGKRAYVKEDTANNVIASGHEPTITKSSDGRVYTFKPYDGARSEITLKLTGVAAVTKFTFSTDRLEDYEVTNDGSDTVEVRLPYGYGSSFTLAIEGANSLSIEYIEHRAGSVDSNITNLREWGNVISHVGSHYENVVEHIRAGIVLHYTLTL